MFKRLVAASLFVAVLANAQDDYDWEDSPANSGSAQTEQAAQPMAASSSTEDYSMSVSIHPISMGIFTLVGIPSIVATVENNLGARLSLVSRPELVWMDLEDDGGKVNMFMFAIYEGVRYYFGEGHRGWYLSPQVAYEYVSLDYQNKRNSSDSGEASVNAFAFLVYGGYKYQSGRFVMSTDVGLGYTFMSGNAETQDDAGSIAGNGFTYDLNFTVGFAF